MNIALRKPISPKEIIFIQEFKIFLIGSLFSSEKYIIGTIGDRIMLVTYS